MKLELKEFVMAGVMAAKLVGCGPATSSAVSLQYPETQVPVGGEQMETSPDDAVAEVNVRKPDQAEALGKECHDKINSALATLDVYKDGLSCAPGDDNPPCPYVAEVGMCTLSKSGFERTVAAINTCNEAARAIEKSPSYAADNARGHALYNIAFDLQNAKNFAVDHYITDGNNKGCNSPLLAVGDLPEIRRSIVLTTELLSQ